MLLLLPNAPVGVISRRGGYRETPFPSSKKIGVATDQDKLLGNRAIPLHWSSC